MRSELMPRGTRHGSPILWAVWTAVATIWLALYVYAAWGFTVRNAIVG
jgi:hypothetical protein